MAKDASLGTYLVVTEQGNLAFRDSMVSSLEIQDVCL